MGNWRRVQIKGTCDIGDVALLRASLTTASDYANFHCLQNGGMLGLPNWAATEIDAVGNLAERDYTVENVKDQLEELAQVAPSLVLTVHCGDEREADNCIATIMLVSGAAIIGEPKVETIPEITQRQVEDNMRAQMRR